MLLIFTSASQSNTEVSYVGMNLKCLPPLRPSDVDKFFYKGKS